MKYNRAMIDSIEKAIKENSELRAFTMVTELHSQRPDGPKYFIIGGISYTGSQLSVSVETIYQDLYESVIQFDDCDEIMMSEVEKIEINHDQLLIYLKMENSTPEDEVDFDHEIERISDEIEDLFYTTQVLGIPRN